MLHIMCPWNCVTLVEQKKTFSDQKGSVGIFVFLKKIIEDFALISNLSKRSSQDSSGTMKVVGLNLGKGIIQVNCSKNK